MLKRNARTLIEAFLVALYFSKPLTSREIYYILKGQVPTPSSFLGKAVFNDYLIKDGYTYKLSKKGHLKARSYNYSLEFHKNKGTSSSQHSNQIIKTLFLFLLHTEEKELIGIRKEKTAGYSIQPDLTLLTKKCNLLIEIDTGTQNTTTVRSKVFRYRAMKDDDNDIVVFCTHSKHTYEEFKDEKTAKFILLDQSETNDKILEINHRIYTLTRNTIKAKTSSQQYDSFNENQDTTNQPKKRSAEEVQAMFDQIVREFGHS
jgi:hypothetical protein